MGLSYDEVRALPSEVYDVALTLTHEILTPKEIP